MRFQLTAARTSNVLPAIRALLRSGWRIDNTPARGKLTRNGQLMELHSGQSDLRIRLFVYKVTGSSRGKPDERRIEITSTYQNRLRRLRTHADVVLGYDADANIFIGVDPSRIGHGGSTGNASSFFDRDGLEWPSNQEILIRPRATQLLAGGIEHHAFIRPIRLAEYLFNFTSIHAGSYAHRGKYSGRTPNLSDRAIGARMYFDASRAGDDILSLVGPKAKSRTRRVSTAAMKALERGDADRLRKRKLTPEEFDDLQRQMEENGRLGEEYVLNHERKALRAAGRANLAARVKWISQESVCEGYDIRSFDRHGNEKWIEVKSSSGTGRVFPMSDSEWKTACKAGTKYWIYRVIKVRTSPSLQDRLQNPQELERQGRILRTAMGWRIKFN